MTPVEGEAEMATKRCQFECRHVFALMGFLGFMNVYAMRVNLSVAIVAMVNRTSRTSVEAGLCSSPGKVDEVVLQTAGDFDWDTKTQGLILGSFFWGYIVTQIPGGILAERFSGKYVFGVGMILTSIFALLTPVAARLGVVPLLVVRILQGLGEGVTFPAMHYMMAHWVPPLQRSMFAAFIYGGASFGTVLALPLSGVLASSSLGWPSVFYFFGGLGLLWCILWGCLVFETPAVHPRISRAERRLIQDALGSSVSMAQLHLKVPFHDILRSMPFWAILIAHVGQNWGFYTLLTEMPTYMDRVLQLKIQENGFLSALPFLALFIIANVGSLLIDFCRSKGMSTTLARKLANSVAFFTAALALCCVTYFGCSIPAAVLALTLAVGFTGLCYAGFNVNHLDIAPNFAGLLLGMTNCAATIPGIVAPYVVGLLVDGNEHSFTSWRIVFFISAGIYVSSNVFYMIFASGLEEPWNRCTTQTQSRNTQDSAHAPEQVSLLTPE